MNERDLDEQFRRIVAGWDLEATEPGEGDQPEPHEPPEAHDRADSHEQPREQPDEPEPHNEPDRPDAAGPGPAALPGSLSLPIAHGVPHAWRAAPEPAPDVEAVLQRAHPDPEDHFVPPETSLPSSEEDPMYWTTVGCLVGGVALLLYVVLFDRGGSPWWPITALVSIVTGFVLLVLRGGNDRDPFDDGTRV